MVFFTLDEAREDLSLIKPGDGVAFLDPDGRIRLGHVRIREVRCGKKGCTKCPHKSYAYAQYRVGKKVSEQYIGVVR